MIAALLTYAGALAIVELSHLAARPGRALRFARPREEALIAIVAVCVQVAVVTLAFATLAPRASASAARYDLERLTAQLVLVILATMPLIVVLVARRQAPATVLLGVDRARMQLVASGAFALLAVTAAGKVGALTSLGVAELLRLMAFLSVGMAEELLDRGLLQTRLVAWLGVGAGWPLAAAIFAAAHVPQDVLVQRSTSVDLVIMLVQQLVAGLVFGWIVLRLGAVLPAAALHGIADWAGWL